ASRSWSFRGRAMHSTQAGVRRTGQGRGRRWAARLLGAALVCGPAGCASLTNPVGDAIPVRLVPPDLLAPSKRGDQTIPLTCLGQPPAATYRLAPGDVLGVYIE